MFYNQGMNLAQLLDHMQRSPYFAERITAWHEVPERAALLVLHYASVVAA
jgi:hypothetical protein